MTHPSPPSLIHSVFICIRAEMKDVRPLAKSFLVILQFELVVMMECFVLVAHCVRRSHSVGGIGRLWASSCSQNRLQEPRGRHRLSTVIQPLRQSAGEVVDLTVDEDGEHCIKSTQLPNISAVNLPLFSSASLGLFLTY